MKRVVCPLCGAVNTLYSVLGFRRCICGWIEPRADAPTVKRATLFDGVQDTFKTEGELNGWRPSQGGLL